MITGCRMWPFVRNDAIWAIIKMLSGRLSKLGWGLWMKGIQEFFVVLLRLSVSVNGFSIEKDSIMTVKGNNSKILMGRGSAQRERLERIRKDGGSWEGEVSDRAGRCMHLTYGGWVRSR